MRIRLYNMHDTILIVGGMTMCHLLVLGLCSFFIYRFLFLSYNAAVFLLLVILIGSLILCDILLFRMQIFSRCFASCKFDDDGIHYSILGLKKWTIQWESIQSFGTVGFQTSYGIVFLSTRKHTAQKTKYLITISEEQIVFQASQENWNKAKQYMPEEISAKLQTSLDMQEDRYYVIKKKTSRSA